MAFQARQAATQNRESASALDWRGVTCSLNDLPTLGYNIAFAISYLLQLVPLSAMANLLSLPLELLVYISSFLKTPDLAALRLACKQTEKSLYEWFSEEFFTKKQFMLTQPSLQVLLDISRHPSLSTKLKHLIIATNVYDDSPIRFRDSDACSRFVHVNLRVRESFY